MSGNGIRCLAQAVHRWPGWARRRRHRRRHRRRPARGHRARARPTPVTHSLSVAMGPATARGRGARVGRRRRGPSPGRRHRATPTWCSRCAEARRAGRRGRRRGRRSTWWRWARRSTPRCRRAPTCTCVTGGRRSGIAVRTYERGVGLTLACGTGACASAAAARAWGLVGDRCRSTCPAAGAEVARSARGRRPRRAAGPGHRSWPTIELAGRRRGADRTGLPGEDRARRRHHPARHGARRPRARSTSWRCWSTRPAPTRSAASSSAASARPGHLRRQGQGRGAARAGAWPPTATRSCSTTS